MSQTQSVADAPRLQITHVPSRPTLRAKTATREADSTSNLQSPITIPKEPANPWRLSDYSALSNDEEDTDKVSLVTYSSSLSGEEDDAPDMFSVKEREADAYSSRSSVDLPKRDPAFTDAMSRGSDVSEEALSESGDERDRFLNNLSMLTSNYGDFVKRGETNPHGDLPPTSNLETYTERAPSSTFDPPLHDAPDDNVVYHAPTPQAPYSRENEIGGTDDPEIQVSGGVATLPIAPGWYNSEPYTEPQPNLEKQGREAKVKRSPSDRTLESFEWAIIEGRQAPAGVDREENGDSRPMPYGQTPSQSLTDDTYEEALVDASDAYGAVSQPFYNLNNDPMGETQIPAKSRSTIGNYASWLKDTVSNLSSNWGKRTKQAAKKREGDTFAHSLLGSAIRRIQKYTGRGDLSYTASRSDSPSQTAIQSESLASYNASRREGLDMNHENDTNQPWIIAASAIYDIPEDAAQNVRPSSPPPHRMAELSTTTPALHVATRLPDIVEEDEEGQARSDCNVRAPVAVDILPAEARSDITQEELVDLNQEPWARRSSILVQPSAVNTLASQTAHNCNQNIYLASSEAAHSSPSISRFESEKPKKRKWKDKLSVFGSIRKLSQITSKALKSLKGHHGDSDSKSIRSKRSNLSNRSNFTQSSEYPVPYAEREFPKPLEDSTCRGDDWCTPRSKSGTTYYGNDIPSTEISEWPDEFESKYSRATQEEREEMDGEVAAAIAAAELEKITGRKYGMDSVKSTQNYMMSSCKYRRPSFPVGVVRYM